MDHGSVFRLHTVHQSCYAKLRHKFLRTVTFAAEAVLEKIGLLKESILARAFCGELGTSDPTEESALDLLKKLL